MMKLKTFSKWVSALLIGLVSVAVWAQQDPVQLLRSIANNMINGLRASQVTLRTNPGIVYALVNRYVVPYADLTEMSRRVLPPVVWEQASHAQQVQFKQAFTHLLIRTYASALAAYRDQTVTFYDVRGGISGQSSVEVASQITSPHNPSPIHVAYRLLRTGQGWRLYDLSVEGVSLLESFRAQFADMLSGRNDLGQLLQAMSRARTRPAY